MEKADIAENKISILIPVYNVEDYIEECLLSTVNQTSLAYEVIVVDDGSTDKSGDICDRYAEKYSFIKVFHKENRGLLSARRYAISKAKGNWYVFMDSDDSLKPNAIERIEKCITNYDVDCIVYGLDRLKDGEVLKAFEPETGRLKVISEKSELYLLVFTHSTLNSLCRKAVRAELMTDDYSEFYGISLAEDLLQSIEIYKKGSKFLFTDESLYNYRLNDQSMTNTIELGNYKVDFTVREQVINLLKTEDVFSSDQWEKYSAYALAVFADQVKTILKFRAKREELLSLFKKLKKSDYYKNYISKIDVSLISGIKRSIMKAFNKDNYSYLYIINILYRFKNRRNTN